MPSGLEAGEMGKTEVGLEHIGSFLRETIETIRESKQLKDRGTKIILGPWQYDPVPHWTLTS